MEADYASVSQSQSVHHSGLNDDVSLFDLFRLLQIFMLLNFVNPKFFRKKPLGLLSKYLSCMLVFEIIKKKDFDSEDP